MDDLPVKSYSKGWFSISNCSITKGKRLVHPEKHSVLIAILGNTWGEPVPGPKTWGVHHMRVSEHVVAPKFMATSNVVFLDNVYTKPIDLGMMFIDFRSTRPDNINLGLIGSWLNCWNYPEMETFLWEETWSQLSRCWYSLTPKSCGDHIPRCGPSDAPGLIKPAHLWTNPNRRDITVTWCLKHASNPLFWTNKPFLYIIILISADYPPVSSHSLWQSQ